jgi:hypothetical protein
LLSASVKEIDMLTSPTTHVSVLGASVLASLHTRRTAVALAAAPTVMNPFARRPLGKPLSRGERAGVFVTFAAVAVWLTVVLVRADAQPLSAPAPQPTPSTQAEPRV